MRPLFGWMAVMAFVLLPTPLRTYEKSLLKDLRAPIPARPRRFGGPISCTTNAGNTTSAAARLSARVSNPHCSALTRTESMARVKNPRGKGDPVGRNTWHSDLGSGFTKFA